MPAKPQPIRNVRVRDIPLSEIDETKLALAFWLIAKRRIEEGDSDGELASP